MSIPNLSQFELHQNEPFQIHFQPDDPIHCEIKEVTVSHATPNAQGEQQFSVLFRQPESMVHEQGVYAVSHAELGTFDLFLVPVYGDDQEVHYEAVFT